MPPPTVTLLALLASAAVFAQGQPPTLRTAVLHGRVTDTTNSPVSGARVALLGSPRLVLSRDDGTFRFEDLAPGTFVLSVRRLGYLPSRPDTLEVLEGGVVERTVALIPAVTLLSQVVITPGSYALIETNAPSRQALSREELLIRPQLAEDIFRSLNRLPGLSGSDFSAKLRVRNGGQDEVLVLLDGLELIEPFHLKDFDGALSILDAEAIGRAELTTGGFGAAYGNRLAGVIEMESATPDRERHAIGLSLSNVRARSAGRFSGDAGSWLVSARRGYLDLLFKLIDESDPPDPRYYDVFAKASRRLGTRHLLSAHTLLAGDELKFREDGDATRVDSRYDNAYAWLTLRSQFTERFAVTTLLSRSHLTWKRAGRETDLFLRQPYERARIDDNRRLDVLGLKQDWAFDYSDRLSALGGFELRDERADYTYDRVSRFLAPDGNTVVVLDSQRVQAAIAPSGQRRSLWGAVRVRPLTRLTSEVGLRSDYHEWTAQHTLVPRINLAFDVTPSFSVRAAWGQHRQAHALQDLSIVDGDTAFASAERAEHRVIGFEFSPAARWSVRGEVYERRLRDPRPRWINTDGDVDALPEGAEDRLQLTPRDGRVRGVEWLVQFDDGGPVRASASYVLSSARATQRGVSTPRPFDERHAVALDVAARTRSGWTWALSLTARSGWPSIPARFRVDTLGSSRFVTRRIPSPPLFTDRLDGYVRTDLRLSRAFELGRGRLALFTEVFNLLDRSNRRGSSWRARAPAGRLQIEQFPEYFLPRLPSLGVRWDF